MIFFLWENKDGEMEIYFQVLCSKPGQKQANLERNQSWHSFFFNFSKYKVLFFYLTKKSVNVFSNHSYVVCKVSTHFVVDIKQMH